jgi:adenine C2-methylase RlmN of 23S rRNA A2503 and tRNA A37
MITEEKYLEAKKLVADYESEQLNKRIVTSTFSVRDYDWIKPNIKAWMQGVVMFPVEVTILNSNSDKKEALVKTSQQEGWIEWNRLYKSEDECPCR